MTTTLTKFSDAYATMTVASYQPIIVEWVSNWTIGIIAQISTLRIDTDTSRLVDEPFDKRFEGLPNLGKIIEKNRDDIAPSPVDPVNRALSQHGVRQTTFENFPHAVKIDGVVYPEGILDTEASEYSQKRQRRAGNPKMGPRVIPLSYGSHVRSFTPSLAQQQTVTRRVYQALVKSALEATRSGSKQVMTELNKTLAGSFGWQSFQMWPAREDAAYLSPIGVAHYYRQLYFNLEEGVGPIEEAFTIAPLETFEVTYEVTRRQTHEEIIELGSETVSEQAAEVKNLDEVSDKVSSMVESEGSAGISAKGSYGSVGVWQVGASSNIDLSSASQRSREVATRKLKEVTKRASERITKSFTIRSRDVEELSTTNMTRRVIQNNADHPVSYGLRRVLRRVRVKVQDLGPQMVWQVYICNPGERLATSKFVHFQEGENISVPELPPGVPPRPKGGTETGTQAARVEVRYLEPDVETYWITLVIQPGPDREVTSVSIDSISDTGGQGKSAGSGVYNGEQMDNVWDPESNTYTVKIRIGGGGSGNFSVNYSYAWAPTQEVIDEWKDLRSQRMQDLEAKAQAEAFDRQKELITERSKIRARPANDLRREERYEVMNRMVSYLFEQSKQVAEPAPLEIEYFHRYFDIDAMFIYQHPSWWRPRFLPPAPGFSLRPSEYEITSESEPAPMGRSLGWLIQLDGDERRNAFLNSPWVRVCIPIKAGHERDAIAWLAEHVEGQIGYNPNAAPLKDLLEKFVEIRQQQDSLGLNGPDYVTVDSSPGAPAGPPSPEGVYPIIDEFDVTVPTDGFVFDKLLIDF